ncbi:hypothetical protein Tco_1461625 [Tanacetum coccineum]
MTSLAEHIIVAGDENRPLMLVKYMYDLWASRIRLFIKGKKHGRIMLDSIDNGPLFVTDVNLAKSLYTTNYDQLYAYLRQHERHAQEVRVMRERYPDPLALVANSQTLYNPSQSPQHSVPTMHLPPQQFTLVYATPIHSGLTVPTFQQGEDPIECINNVIAFLSVVASRFPPSNNQLRINRGIATTSKGNYAAGQAKVMKCYNCLGEGHMAKHYTQPKRLRNSAWFKEKLMLVKAQEAGQILDEEQLAFIADPGIAKVQVAQQTIPQNSAFQTEDLDAYDSDCDDLSFVKAVQMVNLSNYDSDVLSKVPYSDTYLNDVINQDESQDTGIQDTNSSIPNDLLVLSLVEQMTEHVANLDKENQTNKMENESLTVSLRDTKNVSPILNKDKM